MRLLLITSAYPARDVDARGIFIHQLARALVREGVDVAVLAPGAPGAMRTELRDGVKVQRVPYWINRWQSLALGVGGIVPNLRRRPWLLVQLPFLVGAMTWRAVTIAHGFDVLHGHWLYPGGLAAVIAGGINRLPVIVTSHGGDLGLAKRSVLLRWLSRRVSLAAARCIGVSHAMVDELLQIGIPRDRVTFVPLGVDVSENSEPVSFEHRAQRERVAAFDGLRVIYVGSLIPRKSVHTLLHAHELLQRRGHRIATLVVGSGPLEPQLRAIVGRQGIEDLYFVGSQPPQSIRYWVSAADVLVLPSRWEGRGLVLAEAMSLGLPVIASDIPGARELAIQGRTGLCFPPGDSEALADCLRRLLENPALRRRLGENGQAFIRLEGLTTQHSARMHLEVYLDCASHHQITKTKTPG